MTAERDTRAPCRRESTDGGPDYCEPCSDHLQEWVRWDGHRELVATVDFLRDRADRLRAEYVPPRDWPAEAWEPLLDRFFAGELEGEKVKGSYVLLRIPDDLAERIEEHRDALDAGHEAAGDCCADMAPGADGARQEGAEWTCPECGALYAWVIEEAEGAWWALVRGASLDGGA